MRKIMMNLDSSSTTTATTILVHQNTPDEIPSPDKLANYANDVNDYVHTHLRHVRAEAEQQQQQYNFKQANAFAAAEAAHGFQDYHEEGGEEEGLPPSSPYDSDEEGYLENQSQYYHYSDTVDVCLLEKYNRILSSSTTNTHHHQDQDSDFVLLPSNHSSSNYSSENVGLISRIFCNESSDGNLCWPETLAGETAVLRCSFHLNGLDYDTPDTATRVCNSMGIWLKSDYSHCIAETTPQGHESDPGSLQITTTLYLCGYSISLFFLCLAIIIFISLKELYCLRNKIHTQLILTYILADALWIATNITGFKANMGGVGHVSCITFILLHYFHVTTFFWMFVEGLYLYILVVQTFIADNIKLRTYSLIGWGIPLLILVIWSIVKWMTQPEIYQQVSVINDPEYPEYPLPSCLWLVNTSQYDWIFKAPVIFVLAGNIVFLFQIMWVLITKLRSAMNPETQQSRKAAKALLVLMPLLGITYLLILTGSKDPIYEHIRALLISTQGFLVALLYCFCNAEVRTALRHRWSRVQEWCTGAIPCCGCEFEGLQNVQQMRDSSPRSRTESIKLYTPNIHEFRKRESSGVSDITTMSTIRGGSLNGSPNMNQTMAIFNKKNGSRMTTTTGSTTVYLASTNTNNSSSNANANPQRPTSPWSSLRGSHHNSSRHSKTSNNHSTNV